MNALTPVYAEFIQGFGWDVYHTQTFKNRRNDGHNAATAFWDVVSSKHNWNRAFVAVERHKLGGVHLHSLLADDQRDWTDLVQAHKGISRDINRTREYCQKAFGFNAISPISSALPVSLYCAKYVTKSNGDYYFFGDWSWEG